MTLSEQKTALRQQMRARRNALSLNQRAAFSSRICQNLVAFPSMENAQVIAAYLATSHEANVDNAIAFWLGSKRVVVPALGLKPRFDVLDDLHNVKTNARGLRVPLSQGKIAAWETEVIVVPGLAFDARGNRLGQGGGWYDRVLERARGKGNPLVIGVCYECQIEENVPHDERDARVDFVVTEDRVLEMETTR